MSIVGILPRLISSWILWYRLFKNLPTLLSALSSGSVSLEQPSESLESEVQGDSEGKYSSLSLTGESLFEEGDSLTLCGEGGRSVSSVVELVSLALWGEVGDSVSMSLVER